MNKVEEKMNKSFARKLRDEFQDLSSRFNEVIAKTNDAQIKVQASFDVTRNIFGILGDLETKLEALRTLCLRTKVFSEGEYEAVWDEKKGLRVRGPSEEIQSGDILRLSCKGVEVETNNVMIDDGGFSVIVGDGNLIFEKQVLGQKAGVGEIKFNFTYPDPYQAKAELSGKTLAFEINIDKVKCRNEDANGSK